MEYKNKIKCKLCGDIIESKSRHDWRQCKCGSVFVDGGLDYSRVGWDGDKKYEDCIEVILEEIGNRLKLQF